MAFVENILLLLGKGTKKTVEGAGKVVRKYPVPSTVVALGIGIAGWFGLQSEESQNVVLTPEAPAAQSAPIMPTAIENDGAVVVPYDVVSAHPATAYFTDKAWGIYAQTGDDPCDNFVDGTTPKGEEAGKSGAVCIGKDDEGNSYFFALDAGGGVRDLIVERPANIP